jgi:hypothetical protein
MAPGTMQGMAPRANPGMAPGTMQGMALDMKM